MTKVKLEIEVDEGGLDWAREMYRRGEEVQFTTDSGGSWWHLIQNPTNSLAAYRIALPEPERPIPVEPHTAPWALAKSLAGKKVKVMFKRDNGGEISYTYESLATFCHCVGVDELKAGYWTVVK